MSEVAVSAERFWREFDPEVAASFSKEQREQIERALLKTDSSNNKLGDLRLSCHWFFVRLVWGPETRNFDRIKRERKLHPVMTMRNAPVLASFFAGYYAVCYAALALSALLFLYAMS